MTPNQLIEVLRRTFKHEGLITETYVYRGYFSQAAAGTLTQNFNITAKFGPMRIRRVFADWIIQLSADGSICPFGSYTKACIKMYVSGLNWISNTLISEAFDNAPGVGLNGLQAWFYTPGAQKTFEHIVTSDTIQCGAVLETADATATKAFYTMIVDVERLVV